MHRLGPVPARVRIAALAVAGCVLAAPAAVAAAVPPNDDFADAVDLGSASPASASGSNLWATTEPREPSSGYGAATSTVWYRWAAPRDGVVRAATCRSSFDTTLAVYRGTALGALGRVGANDQGCGQRSVVHFFAETGTVYHLAVGGYRQAQGSVELRLRELESPANDDLEAATDLGDSLPASADGTNRDATVEPRERGLMGGRWSATVWFRWTAPEDRTVVASTCGAGFDTVLAVHQGAAHDALRRVARNDDGCGRGSRARFRAVEGRTYAIAVGGFRGSVGDFRLRLRGVRTPQRRID